MLGIGIGLHVSPRDSDFYGDVTRAREDFEDRVLLMRAMANPKRDLMKTIGQLAGKRGALERQP